MTIRAAAGSPLCRELSDAAEFGRTLAVRFGRVEYCGCRVALRCVEETRDGIVASFAVDLDSAPLRILRPR